MDRYDRPLPSTALILPGDERGGRGETGSRSPREKAQYLNSLISPELSLKRRPPRHGAGRRHQQDARRKGREFVAAAGHQGHGGSADRVFQIMAAEKISFAEAARRPRATWWWARPRPSPITCRQIFEAGGGDGFVLMPNLFPVMFEESSAAWSCRSRSGAACSAPNMPAAPRAGKFEELGGVFENLTLNEGAKRPSRRVGNNDNVSHPSRSAPPGLPQGEAGSGASTAALKLMEASDERT